MVALSAPPVAHVHLRPDPTGIQLHLPPPELLWEEVWDQLSLRLQSSRRFWQAGCELTLWAGSWDLDVAQLQALAALLSGSGLRLQRVQTERRATAIAAASLGYSVEQTSPLVSRILSITAEPLYLQTTVRSGTEIRHPSSVVLMGDLNPGGDVIAGGDILVWGRLRGVAHAGSEGDASAVIMALQLDPTQLRIADQVARPPETPAHPTPEVAYLKDNVICIATVQDYLAVYRVARGRV